MEDKFITVSVSMLKELISYLPRCDGHHSACSERATHGDNEGGRWCDHHAQLVIEQDINGELNCQELNSAQTTRKVLDAIRDS